MPVNTISYNDYHQNGGNGRRANRTNNRNQNSRPRRSKCRAIQRESRINLLVQGQAVAVDTEGVILDAETGLAKNGLGRVSVADRNKQIIYDTFAYYPKDTPHRPPPQRFELGVRYDDIRPENGAQPIAKVLEDLEAIFNIAGNIIGHDLGSDMTRLRTLPWHKWETRDTQLVPEWRHLALDKNKKNPSLKILAKEVLQRSIQSKDHSSCEDAIATMDLYLLKENDIERLQSSGSSSSPSSMNSEDSAADFYNW